MDEEIIINGILLLFLAAAAWEDMKTGGITVILLASGAMAGVLARIITGHTEVPDMAVGAGIGLVLLIISFGSRQALGYGDGLLLAVSGICLGGMKNLILLLISLVMAALCSAFLVMTGKKKSRDRIPFAPFVLGGFVLMTGTLS